MKRARIFLGVAAILILGMACNLSAGGNGSQTTPTSPPVENPTQAPLQATATEAPPANPLDLVRSATIQIEAQGSFVDPQYGDVYNATGLGSGFIIDPSGIAVTNNHVVTGSALIKVYVSGETQPRNARILGVSECWDLAVIKIDGDNFPYLKFHDGDVQPGLEVYAAGFPLGDPEYTLTKGIVSKAKANGETYWASVDAVIEQTAQILPGNSGGPLVDDQGNVVGINYAANDTYNTNYAIRGSDAQSVIDKLEQGQDFESIGINGQAVQSDDGSVTGIWVSSVKSGSPADKSGVEGGDIITRMEGLVLATDGTMADYCDIIRTRNPTDALSIEVLRYSSQEYLAGEINGSPLETEFSFAQELNSDTQNSGTTYSDYVSVQDDYSSIQVSIPSSWSQVDGSAWPLDNEIIGASISAAADLNAFNSSYDEPGMFFGVSDQIAEQAGYVQLLDAYRDSYSQDCKLEGRYDYSDAVFEGAYDLYSDCLGTGNLMVVLSARPQQNQTAFLATVLVNIMSDADLDALDEILATFDVIGPLP